MKTLKNLLTPLAVAVVLAMASSASAQVITPRERAVLRHDVARPRQDLRQFGPTYNRTERAILRRVERFWESRGLAFWLLVTAHRYGRDEWRDKF